MGSVMKFRSVRALFVIAGLSLSSSAFATEAVEKFCPASNRCPCSTPAVSANEAVAPAQGGAPQSMGSMNMGPMGGMIDMNHTTSFIDEILHHASAGTSAEPNSTPHDMLMKQKGAWMLMFHGAASLDSQQQTG